MMATDGLSWNLEGLDAALVKLKTVKEFPQNKSTRFALRKAANLVRDAAKLNAQRIDDPETSNSIPDNLVIRFDGQHFRQTGDPKMSIGIRGGAASRQQNQRNSGGDTYYWRFLEFGTENQRAQPFMRPALTDNIGPATAEFVQQFDKAIVRAIRRANKAKR